MTANSERPSLCGPLGYGTSGAPRNAPWRPQRAEESLPILWGTRRSPSGDSRTRLVSVLSSGAKQFVPLCERRGVGAMVLAKRNDDQRTAVAQ